MVPDMDPTDNEASNLTITDPTNLLFEDGFESGSTSGWSAVAPIGDIVNV